MSLMWGTLVETRIVVSRAGWLPRNQTHLFRKVVPSYRRRKFWRVGTEGDHSEKFIGENEVMHGEESLPGLGQRRDRHRILQIVSDCDWAHGSR